MINLRLIEAIRVACDKFDHGEITLGELQASIENNGRALEGVATSVYAALHDYCNALELIEFTCRAEDQDKEGRNVTSQVRGFLNQLEKLL